MAAQRRQILAAFGPAARPHAAGRVLQARWVGEGRYLKWVPVQGHAWWFDQRSHDSSMAQSDASVEALDDEAAGKLVWKPHKVWQKEALEEINPDAGPAPDTRYASLVDKGRKRWSELTGSKKHVRSIDPTTQAARDWFFKEYYDTHIKPSDHVPTEIVSNYNARPKSYDTKNYRQKGEYTTAADTAYGVMVPNQTYALGGPGEVYYNPGTGNAERMPPSEILFQQWRLLAQAQAVQEPKLKHKEETVAGDGVSMLWEIRKHNQVDRGKDVEFLPGSEGFLAMLAVPNVTAAIYLIQDHGKELGIDTITKIFVGKAGHIAIYFG